MLPSSLWVWDMDWSECLRVLLADICLLDLNKWECSSCAEVFLGLKQYLKIEQMSKCAKKQNTFVTNLVISSVHFKILVIFQGSICLTRNRSVDRSRWNRIKGSYCFLEQKTLPSLLSTGWFQEWIQHDLDNEQFCSINACFTIKLNK